MFWYTNQQEEELKSRYPSEGAKPLAQEWQVSLSRVRNLAAKLEVRVNRDYRHRLAQVRTQTRSLNNPNVNVTYFQTWSPNMAYVLGYIWADGWIQEGVKGKRGHILGLKCTIADRALVEGVREEMRSNHKLTELPARFNPKTDSWSKPQVTCSICSSPLVEDLKKLGIRQGKSKLDLPWPHPQFLNHFCRGYLDGDGHVGDRSKDGGVVYFTGSPRFITGLQLDVCAEVGLPQNKLGRDKGLRRASWYHPTHLSRLYEWLYPEGTQYLFGHRKKNSLVKLLEN